MRFAVPLSSFFFCALALAPTLGARAAGGPSLESLLAKARAASGAPYRYHVVSRSRETEDGRDYAVTTETEGLKYRARRCLGSVCVTGFYFDGERSFNTNFNDTALPLSERVDGLQLTLRAIASYAFTAPSFRADGGQLEDRDTVLRDGKTYRRVGVAPRLGALLDAVIDPDTGLVVGVISDARRLAFEFRDQRKVGGVLTLPYAIALNGAQIEKFDDRSIDPQPLGPPPGIAPSAPAVVAMTRADAPIVQCSIGGQTASCLLDTGNSGLAMSAELAAKLGLTPQTGGGLFGTPGGTIAGIVKAPSLAIGAAVYPGAYYLVVGGIHAAGYDIALGADAFAHARITLDFSRRIVAIAPGSGTSTGGIPLDFENFVPHADATIGTLSVPLPLDTGDASVAELASEFATAHPAAASATTLRIGNDQLDDVRLTTSGRIVPPDRGVIGSGFLSHFVTTFDYARARVSLVPRAGDQDAKTLAP